MIGSISPSVIICALLTKMARLSFLGALACVLTLFFEDVASQNCSIPGLCQGTIVSTTAGASKADCVELCQNTETCEYFTYDYDDTFCGAYTDCDDVDENCVSCISGEDECPPLTCNAPGGCNGQLIYELNVLGTDLTCGDFCQDDSSCTWYTYFPDVGNCLLFSTCQFDTSVCEGCFSSEKDCDEDSANTDEYPILLAVTAVNYGSINVVDLNNPNSNCESISLGPLSSAYAFALYASYVNERFLLCGQPGYGCFYLDDGLGEWINGPSMLEGRDLSYALDVNSTLFWQTGGNVETTEIYDGTQFSYGIDLPSANLACHCVVPIGGDEMLLVGDCGTDDTAYIININTGSYSTLTYPSTGDIRVPACGLATKSDGSTVAVITGGNDLSYNAVDSTYIYDIALGVFLPGPPLPEARTYARAVPYRNSFIVVGGGASTSTGSTKSEDILFYDPDGERWEVFPQKLTTPDFVTAAVLVSDEFNPVCL